MSVSKSVTLANIAAHLTNQPTFMAFELDKHVYANQLIPKQLLAKKLTTVAYPMGKVTFTQTALALADEFGAPLLTVPVADVTGVTVGIYQTVVGDLGAITPISTQYTLNLVVKTTMATYDLLNQDLTAVPALLTWLAATPVAVTDPMQLRAQLGAAAPTSKLAK